jgi:hypothetical protein
MTTAANATTKITVDSGWQSFITAAGTTVLRSRGRGSSPALLSSKVTVTDAFCHGDEFRVYDKDVPLGDTSQVASEFPACPFELFFPGTARADAAFADPAFSHGVFFIAPGKHAIEFENKALWSETSIGTGAFFRVDSVTVAKSDCKNGGWMNYGSLVKTQGQCLSVAT